MAHVTTREKPQFRGLTPALRMKGSLVLFCSAPVGTVLAEDSACVPPCGRAALDRGSAPDHGWDRGTPGLGGGSSRTGCGVQPPPRSKQLLCTDAAQRALLRARRCVPVISLAASWCSPALITLPLPSVCLSPLHPVHPHPLTLSMVLSVAASTPFPAARSLAPPFISPMILFSAISESAGCPPGLEAACSPCAAPMGAAFSGPDPHRDVTVV